MLLRKIILLCGLLCISLAAAAQFPWGTTGLLHLPTADMQKDKTFMFGGGRLHPRATPDAHSKGWDREATYNYYINVTFFPWFEASYTCTLVKGWYLAGEKPAVAAHFRKWANQDRNFSFRLRAWKEGWWKSWTPQIVFGANDALHTFSQKGSGHLGIADGGNGFWGRFYVAATKHIEINGLATVGLHAAYMHNNREDFKYKGVGAGMNLSFNKLQTGSSLADKILQPINLMAEYDSRTVNIGGSYSLWADHINFIAELNDCKYPSAGLYFKIHLK